ncbi:uncharacterized protein LOC106143274 [Amyelois transitella]|uniref:uncharacterized protein LOC106143274 n=1 Tax=Amyelois transitella TaxID=680683 RepID=UPI0029904730|nr:uncharacterized protein LOC106143274 [Amyelois transitella]
MEGCIRVVKQLFSQIEKGRSNFKKAPKERITESYVLTRLESLETIIDKFSDKHEYIIATYEDTEGYIESDIYNIGYEMYLSYKTELKSALKALSPNVSTASSSLKENSDKNKESLVRLPKITIPVFSGKYTEWSSFKDLFTSLIHNNCALDDVQRLHYLKTQSMSCESAQGLKDLLDTTSDCIHELTNLDIKVDTWDVIIIYIVSQKLDADTRKQWEIHINNCSVDLPSYCLFKDFIESRYRALEFVEPTKRKVSSQTLLATALVKAESRNGSPLILRALLDQGSQASFISEAAVQLLRLNKVAEKTSISGLGGGQSGLTSKYVVKVTIQSLCDPTFKLQVKAHVLQTVTTVLPQRKFTPPRWTELGRISLADPQYNSPNRIDVLLGSEVYCAILKKGLIKSPNDLIIAQDTYLGWVLSGQVDGYDNEESTCHNIIMSFHIQLEENELIKKFWEIESEPSPNKKILTQEEQDCEDHFKATTCRDETGRYVVELPFRPNVRRDYGDTRSVTVKRLFGLEKRLDKNCTLKKNYSEVIDEYLKLGHMEIVDDESSNMEGKVWLPHHAVVRMDRTTTKTRVVFNAADRSANGLSLNDTLMVGPTLQMELRHLIMRWRSHPICITADIIKMYRQVNVAAKHTDFQRIVWRSEEGIIRDYRLLTVTFGTSCAPYLAVKAMQQVAVDEGRNFPHAASRVLSDFYMDDLLTGAENEEEAVKIYKEMNELLNKGGFQLQKWTCNKIGVLGGTETDTEREFKEDDVTKIVGIAWNRRTDEFGYNIKISSDAPAPETKRKVISEICRLYDPLGWIAPYVIIAKIFIQKLWIAGLGWDDKLPEELIQEWSQYRKELPKLELFHIPRWVRKKKSDIKVELHRFSDASNAGYAAVIYIRCVTMENEVYTHLVTAKTKVAPIKQISIPRLELCAAVLVTKLLLEVSETLNINKSDIHAWTDSTIVLAWLSDHPSRWKSFVANRTSEILTLINATQWSYVSTKENPADCASRGMSPSEFLENSLWKNGPSWLQNSEIDYVKPRSICTKTELEKRQLKAHTTCVKNFEEIEDICSRFSSLRKLIRVIAYCRRFLHLKNTTSEESKHLPYLTAKEIQESLTCCILQHQRRWFADEISMLLKNKNDSMKKLIKLLSKAKHFGMVLSESTEGIKVTLSFFMPQGPA